MTEQNLLMIKWNLQGGLIYLTMGGYLLILLLLFISGAVYFISKQFAVILCKITRFVFFSAFLLSVASLVYRWNAVQHLPMQNMFEVFLFLGFTIYPIHLLSSIILNSNHPTNMAIDAAIGLIVLFPAGFIFKDTSQYLPPALQFWLFGPHVAAYMLAYIFMGKAAVLATAGLIVCLFNKNFNLKMADWGYRLIAAGFPLLTLGLFLGSIWGKFAWGDWWGWDPKELWSLVCWLVYALYFHVRFSWPKQYTLHHVLNILGLVCIIITLLWVNLSKLFPGLHNYAS